MKIKAFLTIFLIAALFIAPANNVYADTRLDNRIEDARYVLEDIMISPDQSIPEELLAKCKAIAIYPNVLKGAFIFGGRFGRGVVLARNSYNGKWGPVAFSTIGGGSWGFQIGGQMTDLILVIMSDRGMEGLLSNNFTLGGGAEVAAGPVGRHTEMSTDLSLRAGILSYSRSRGLFAGVALNGAVLTQDNNSNSEYYGTSVSSTDILIEGSVNVAPSSLPLVNALDEYSSLWAHRPGAKQ